MHNYTQYLQLLLSFSFTKYYTILQKQLFSIKTYYSVLPVITQ